MRLDLADVFTSKAKFKVLEVLSEQEHALQLRTIADLCQIPIRSVALAIESLIKQKVIQSRTQNHHRRFVLNSDHEFFIQLQIIYTELKNEKIRRRSRSYNIQAQRSLNLTQSMQLIFRQPS